MSCIRYLTRSRASLFARRYLHQPSIAHFDRGDDGDFKRNNSSPSLQRTSSFSPHTRFQTASKIGLFRSPTNYSGFPVSPRLGASFHRSLSTGNRDSDHSDIAEFLSENAVETIDSSAPAAVVNEVAAAAADSFIPATIVQHLIDAVHCYTGFNWWASIVIVTLISRGILMQSLHQFVLQTVSKKKKKEIQATLLSLISVLKKLQRGEGVDVEHMKEYMKPLKEAAVTSLRALTVDLIKAWVHVRFYLEISIMAEKVPSFKAGGSFWFLDLSTPDSLYILPVLTALSIWFPAKAENMVAVWVTHKVGKARMILALLSLPFTVGLPKAVLVYWLAHAIFDRVFNIVEFLWLAKSGRCLIK